MVEVNCETDFVARNDEFRQLAKDLAVHIVAAHPQYVSREDVPAELVERAKAGLHRPGGGQAGEHSREDRRREADAWFGEVVLLDQKFVKDEPRRSARWSRR